jgi:hypothetical protein
MNDKLKKCVIFELSWTNSGKSVKPLTITQSSGRLRMEISQRRCKALLCDSLIQAWRQLGEHTRQLLHTQQKVGDYTWRFSFVYFPDHPITMLTNKICFYRKYVLHLGLQYTYRCFLEDDIYIYLILFRVVVSINYRNLTQSESWELFSRKQQFYILRHVCILHIFALIFFGASM